MANIPKKINEEVKNIHLRTLSTNFFDNYSPYLNLELIESKPIFESSISLSSGITEFYDNKVTNEIKEKIKQEALTLTIEYQNYLKSELLKEQKKRPTEQIQVSKAYVDRVMYAGNEEKFNKNKRETLQGELFNPPIKFEDIPGNLSSPQLKTIWGLQVLYYKKGYIEAGKIKTTYYQENNRNQEPIEIETPIMKITLSDLCNAIPINKITTKDSKLKFSGNERNSILNSLINEIPNKKFFIYWYEKDDKETKLCFTEKPLFEIDRIEIDGYSNLSRDDKSLIAVKDITIMEKHHNKTNIYVILNPILTHGINKNYFVIFPSNFIEEIRRVKPKHSNRHILFCNYLFFLATTYKAKKNKQINKTMKRNLKIETIVQAIHRIDLLKNKRYSEMEKLITECCEMAKEIGYIDNYKYQNRIYILTLNIDKIRVSYTE